MKKVAAAFCFVFMLASLSAKDPMRFKRDIYPVLQAKCMACHGADPDDLRGGYDLSTRARMTAGGESGKPAVLPGDPDNSPLYRAVQWQDPHRRMPPKENDRLTDEQVKAIRLWILEGAEWNLNPPQPISWDAPPDAHGRKPIQTSGGLTDEWTYRLYRPDDLWAFQPLTRPAVPQIEGVDHPIDAFIQRKLREEGLETAPPASRRDLIRRVSYNLTGLPPTAEQIAAFEKDSGDDAFMRLVERLLASPQYGEHWGRRWLDVARYADTGGFSNDYERPNAWRYRDYVIRAFNEDKPYNQFVKEQIAGDNLDEGGLEPLIAVGFLRMGPWEQTGMSVSAETRQFFLDDVTNSVGATFLSIPLRCARCHDHKTDPIPTRDFYRVQAAFATAQFAEPNVPFLPSENAARFEEGRQRIEALLSETKAQQSALNAKEEKAARKWMEERGLEYLPFKERQKLPKDQKPPLAYGLTYQDLGTRKALNKRVRILAWQLDRYRPIALSVYDGPKAPTGNVATRIRLPESVEGEPVDTFILDGGSIHSPGESVDPGALSVIEMAEGPAAPIPIGLKGRRLALAEWIADDGNPLAARSIVNRVWQWHFGRGLAANSNNFGATGAKPTHPELLDWLAAYFIDSGWSFKELHRLILSSETYRQSASRPDLAETQALDPRNELLARFASRRLTSEELRDSMLQASGELRLEIGGLPIFPEMNLEAALVPRHIMGSIGPAYQPSRTRDERHRRSAYAYRYRGLSDPWMEAFNQPDVNEACETRESSIVTPQALALMNSRSSQDRALAMAAQIETERSEPTGRIERAFQRAFGRNPTAAERQSAERYLKAAEKRHETHMPTPFVYPTSIEREMIEEMTGEPFIYVERLDIYENYEADLKPWEAPPQTRALADLCLLLLNANEFIYIY
ncbi:MAG: DUF1553 domain-containing protein [Candidatus Poribacteria bacterium]|nr:DUF1553 domain-containing protein [Candidatus Poribacteria bacterium]